jgi:plasmid stability protein
MVTMPLAKDTKRYQNESMPNVLIRNIPEEIHQILIARAELAGQSLQQYLVSLMTTSARTPSMAEVMSNIAASERGVFTREQVLASLVEGRDQHDGR